MATYISLVEAGADFNVEIINIGKNEQSNAAYVAINPKKKVPLLVVDGKGLTENVAIQSWIAETYSEANLLPSDRWERVRAVSHMGWFGAGIHPHITRHFKPIKFCADVNSHDDIKAKAKAAYLEQMALVETELTGKTWFFDHYTACDSYFFWIYTRALREDFDLSGFKHCTAHNERMRERASVQKVLAHTAS